MATFVTTRSRNSELWFVNNRELERAILGYAAKFAARYNAKLYALAVEGNHIQIPADFPECNRAGFMRDFNSCVARAVARHTPEYPGGRFWGRRYSGEFLPDAEDIEKQFFYTVLQPVLDGLVERISDYPGYNCFSDAVKGIARKFKVVRYGDYNAAKRHNPATRIKDFTDIVELKYERLPGYEHLSQAEYSKLMHAKLEEHRQRIVAERRSKGLRFLGRKKLLQTPRGLRAPNTKTSTSSSHRPRVLATCPQRRQAALAWYFSTFEWYRRASERYRAGDLTVEFPPGTYLPPTSTRALSPPQAR